MNTCNTETEQKKKGQYFSPDDIVKKMINFTNLNWLGNIYEPTAGIGNIVMKIIDKKISLGMTPQEAIDTTYANEFDTDIYNQLTARLKTYCDEHNINYREENITNQDACVFKPTCDKYEIITNLPFGSWTNPNLPKQIINNYSDIHAVYLTKWSTGCYKKYVPHVKKFENVVFPGIVYDTLLWEYDPEYTEGDIWIYWPLPKLPKHKLKKNWKEELEGSIRRFEMSERLNVKSGLYGIHGGEEMVKLREKVMKIVNHFRKPNLEIVYDRGVEYIGLKHGRNLKNYNINKIKFFKDIPDGIEVLIDYVDVTAIRTMNIPTEIIYESIYRELPELFEE